MRKFQTFGKVCSAEPNYPAIKDFSADQFGEEPSEEYMELRLSIIESDLREHSTLSVLPVVKAMDNKELATSSRWENPAKRELPEEGDSVYSWKRRSELF